MSKGASQQVEGLLQTADVAINGGRPWDIEVRDPRFFRRILTQGSLGLGESYMDGWWHCERIDQLICRLLSAGLASRVSGGMKELLRQLVAQVINLQSCARAFIVGEKHYDLSLDLYRKMLDSRLNYSCAYWKAADNLDQAQLAKLDLICRKLAIKPGDKVLDIGCGWGSFARYAATEYGAEITGITISREQARYARESCEGLPVTIRLEDYRKHDGHYDHIVSIGMFEHVGHKNYRTYFDVARRCLREDGLFLLHSIGGNRSSIKGDPWIHKYIFPNGLIPSIEQVGKALTNRFVMEDWHNFGADYDRTLMAWYDNFVRYRDDFCGQFGERFCRMWEYYLLACAGAFRARDIQLWQLVLSPGGVPGGYQSIR